MKTTTIWEQKKIEIKSAKQLKQIADEYNEENKLKDFPFGLLSEIMERITETAKEGKTSFKHIIAREEIQKDREGAFMNFVKDWRQVSKKLEELGYQCSDNFGKYYSYVYEYYFFLLIDWSKV